MKERRASPRVSKKIPLKICDHDYDVLTETKNISASGAYFPVDRPLAPMTKLSVVLLIPLKDHRKKVIKKITCSGIIVRNEHMPDNNQYPWQVAMYFNNLKESDRKILRNYVAAALSEHS